MKKNLVIFFYIRKKVLFLHRTKTITNYRKRNMNLMEKLTIPKTVLYSSSLIAKWLFKHMVNSILKNAINL